MDEVRRQARFNGERVCLGRSIAILSIRVRYHMARPRVVIVLHLLQSLYRLVDYSMAWEGLPSRLRNTSRRDLAHSSRPCTFLAR